MAAKGVRIGIQNNNEVCKSTIVHRLLGKGSLGAYSSFSWL